jgi:hypothetical protein
MEMQSGTVYGGVMKHGRCTPEHLGKYLVFVCYVCVEELESIAIFSEYLEISQISSEKVVEADNVMSVLEKPFGDEGPEEATNPRDNYFVFR